VALRTLILDANGAGWKQYAADSVVLGVAGLRDYDALPGRLRTLPFVRRLRRRYDTLGYVNDWRDALVRAPALDTRVCNITNLVDYARILRRIDEFDLVIILHSAAGDSVRALLRTVNRLRRRRGKLVAFIGNEYDLMAEKLAFLSAVRADYVCSQLPLDTAAWLYADVAAKVLPMPHALNPVAYSPGPQRERERDIGFIGWLHPAFLGDEERTSLIRAVERLARDGRLELEIRTGTTVTRPEWAAFLKASSGTVGAESGTYYLDRGGTLVAAAKAYLAEHPSTTVDELQERFFAHPPREYRSGKCISSRHFEAIGTETCQILLEGDYNGILEPDVHYIAVRRDLSNLEEALALFADEGHRRELVVRTREFALDLHTYDHRVAELVAQVG
jgi:hypothetical protein